MHDLLLSARKSKTYDQISFVNKREILCNLLVNRSCERKEMQSLKYVNKNDRKTLFAVITYSFYLNKSIEHHFYFQKFCSSNHQ